MLLLVVSRLKLDVSEAEQYRDGINAMLDTISGRLVGFHSGSSPSDHLDAMKHNRLKIGSDD